MNDTAVMLADALPVGEDPFKNEEILHIKQSLLGLLDVQHISGLHFEALDTDVRKPIGVGKDIVRFSFVLSLLQPKHGVRSIPRQYSKRAWKNELSLTTRKQLVKSTGSRDVRYEGLM
ncbi:hypothetical protein FRC12_005204 [Ceratobasidium sp. 428]|nr:hypothetical protein FRC12_005204 [Ceratobasidium sp. 428]